MHNKYKLKMNIKYDKVVYWCMNVCTKRIGVFPGCAYPIIIIILIIGGFVGVRRGREGLLVGGGLMELERDLRIVVVVWGRIVEWLLVLLWVFLWSVELSLFC
jgi:hypothetical protein